MKIGIVGVTISGNMGGQAMLISTMQALKDENTQSEFSLFSIYPHKDQKVNNFKNLEIVDSSPVFLLLFYLPLSFVLYPFRNLNSTQWILSKINFFKEIQSCSFVVDQCGIAFVDGRGLALLLYNVACVLPALTCKKKVYKLSQALGPFKGLLNRQLAKAILKRCKWVVARGQKSLEFLDELKLTNVQQFPDTAYALHMDTSNLNKAETLIRGLNIDTEKLIIISPSRVVEMECKKHNIDLQEQLEIFIHHLLKKSFNVLLLPHSLGSGGSKNNDVDLCNKIFDRLRNKHLHYLRDIDDSVLLRGIIGHASVFVGCRFHSIVSSLAMGRVPLVIGWSHKYAEMMQPFGVEGLAMDAKELSSQRLINEFEEIWKNKGAIELKLKQTRPMILEQAHKNYELITHE